MPRIIYQEPGSSIGRRVLGGEAWRRALIRNASAPRRTAAIAVNLANSILLPRLRSEVPRRTGRLKASLRFRTYGTDVALFGIWYAHLVRWPEGPSVADLANRLAFDTRFNQLVAQALNRELFILFLAFFLSGCDPGCLGNLICGGEA